jgi:hypothetical protein
LHSAFHQDTGVKHGIKGIIVPQPRIPLLNKVRTIPLGVSQGSETKSTGSPQLAQIMPGLPTRREPTANSLQIGLQGTLDCVTSQVDGGNASALISKDACIHSALLRHT